MPVLTILMIVTVEDANEHLVFDADGTPRMTNGTVVVEHRVDLLREGQTYTLPAWQANALIGHGYAQAA